MNRAYARVHVESVQLKKQSETKLLTQNTHLAYWCIFHVNMTLKSEEKMYKHVSNCLF